MISLLANARSISSALPARCVGLGALMAEFHFLGRLENSFPRVAPLPAGPVNLEFRELETLEFHLLPIAFFGTPPYFDSGDEFRTWSLRIH
jgi:hypothetical protein